MFLVGKGDWNEMNRKNGKIKEKREFWFCVVHSVHFGTIYDFLQIPYCYLSSLWACNLFISPIQNFCIMNISHAQSLTLWLTVKQPQPFHLQFWILKVQHRTQHTIFQFQFQINLNRSNERPHLAVHKQNRARWNACS